MLQEVLKSEFTLTLQELRIQLGLDCLPDMHEHGCCFIVMYCLLAFIADPTCNMMI